MKKILTLALILCTFGFIIFKEMSSPSGVGLEKVTQGAAVYKGSNNVVSSIYRTQNDFYNMKSSDTLIILPQFKTLQQKTAYSCGPSAALMVVKYFSPESTATEGQLCTDMNTSKMVGTGTKSMVKYFENNKWSVESCYTHETPEDLMAFRKFVVDHLKANMPILVENIEWGGHWRVIIGYDTMGTQNAENDVLIFADPYDTTDHYQDGYTIASAHRFFTMWFDAHLYPKGEQEKQWLSVKGC